MFRHATGGWTHSSLPQSGLTFFFEWECRRRISKQFSHLDRSLLQLNQTAAVGRARLTSVRWPPPSEIVMKMSKTAILTAQIYRIKKRKVQPVQAIKSDVLIAQQQSGCKILKLKATQKISI